ncbi:alpha/beta fold hydrolase [Oceanicola sp. S124]|uniref:alpha/beta fold hydrolase n=1 Tax=Oceanicola sp. S124 TaxID=1042378 RepID=UPI0002559089|nr:alpha/beta fold hydrolase [Oceanicola sp. S124]
MSLAPLLWLAGAGGALALAPFLREDMRPKVAERRGRVPGEIAELPAGRTRFRWYGEAGDPVAICIHGLTTPAYVWDAVAPQLAGMGYHVLTYDLLGRGWSDRPGGAQEAGFFTTQLSQLMAALDIDGPVTLFGYSMGAAVATAYAAEHPGRIEKLVLVAPAGMGGYPAGLMRWMRDAGWTGRWLFQALYPGMHRRAARRAVAEGVPDQVAKRQAGEALWRGFTPAVLASLRGILRDPQELEHRRVAKAGVPMLTIWAAEDRAIPLEGMGVISRWNRASVQKQVAGAGHWLPLSHPDALVRAFRTWLWEDGEI